MEILLVLLFIILGVIIVFSFITSSASATSKPSLPSKEDIHLRNMEDSSGRFYVDFYRGPYYHGDNWEAIVKAKKREGYFELIRGNSQRHLESKIDEIYTKFAEQWEKENEMLLNKGIDPDRYFEELALGLLDIPNRIDVTYTVFGYDRLGETTFDIEVKDKEYEWLENAEGEEGEITSDYISENRPGLHKRIIKAIRNNMKEEACDPDDGWVETYVSGVHRKEYDDHASYDYASDIAEDDDIEYTVTL